MAQNGFRGDSQGRLDVQPDTAASPVPSCCVGSPYLAEGVTIRFTIYPGSQEGSRNLEAQPACRNCSFDVTLTAAAGASLVPK